MFRSILLMVAAIWAATAPTKSVWLRSYFAAHVIYSSLSLLTRFDISSTAYMALFVARTFLWIACGIAYTAECFVKHGFGRVNLVQCMILPFPVVGASLSLLHPYFPAMSGSIMTALGMGWALTAMGLSIGTIGFQTPHHYRAKILALFWLTYAAWSFAFAYGQPLAGDLFLSLNKWLPAAIVILWFTVFGFVARRNEEV